MASGVSWAEEAATASPAPAGETGDVGTAAAEPEPGGEAEAPVAGTEASDAGTYAVRLRDLESRINQLKEQIFRSKSRLSLLAETVLQGSIAGSKAIIVQRNEMGSSFKLVRAVFALDGAPIYSRGEEEGGDQTEVELFNGSIVPGEHTLSVTLEYRGHGYGIFSYLKGYRFKVRSSHTFTAAEGKTINLRVIAYEKGGPTTPLEERPDVRYVERIDAFASGGAVTEGQEEEEE